MAEERQPNVHELVESFKECLKEKRYSDSSLEHFSGVLTHLTSYCEEHQEIYFSFNLGKKFLEDCYNIQLGKTDGRFSYANRTIEMLIFYQQYRDIPKRRRNSSIIAQGFNQAVDGYLQNLRLAGRKENTVLNHRKLLVLMTEFLIDNNIYEFEYIGLEIVNTFIKCTLKNYCKSQALCYYGILKSFLQYLYKDGYIRNDLSKKLIRVSNTSASSRLPSTLSAEQVSAILSSVDRNTRIGKRDYAILLIAAKLGIRTCDIRNLRCENFDWDKHIIRFTQIKTGEPLALPLPLDVGWAVIDYLKNGRAECSTPEIFIRTTAPYVAITNFNNMLTKYMRKANIPLDSIKHHGLHTLRHSLATNMLDEGISITTIQGVLGQTSVESTQKYIGVNIKQLRSCSLEVN